MIYKIYRWSTSGYIFTGAQTNSKIEAENLVRFFSSKYNSNLFCYLTYPGIKKQKPVLISAS